MSYDTLSKYFYFQRQHSNRIQETTNSIDPQNKCEAKVAGRKKNLDKDMGNLPITSFFSNYPFVRFVNGIAKFIPPKLRP